MIVDFWVKPRAAFPATGPIIVVHLDSETVKYRIPIKNKVYECNHRYLTRYWVIEDCDEYWEVMDRIHDDHAYSKYLMGMIRERLDAIQKS